MLSSEKATPQTATHDSQTAFGSDTRMKACQWIRWSMAYPPAQRELLAFSSSNLREQIAEHFAKAASSAELATKEEPIIYFQR